KGPDFATAGTALSLPLAPTAIRAGDFDGDGDLDLVATGGGTVQVLESTGAAFTSRVIENASTVSIVVADLDLDGRTDFAWIEAGKIQLRRNTGNFTFSTASPVTGSGVPLWLSAGDIDEDGDPDLIATYSTGAYDSVHYLLLNKVQ
ncbi:MAG: FG-GAP repeat domain-containing protein, partial [Myxococcaceae bacterium]